MFLKNKIKSEMEMALRDHLIQDPHSSAGGSEAKRDLGTGLSHHNSSVVERELEN